MEENTNKSGWRWVIRIALGIFILLVLAIGGGIIYFKSLPMPDPKEFAAAEQRYRQVRSLFPNSTSPKRDARQTTSTANIAGTSQTLQARCDRLFAALLMKPYDPFRGEYNPRLTREDLDNAKALAALYGQGVRVSPEARASYRMSTNGRLLGFMAKALLLDIKPGDGNLAITEKSIKARRISDAELPKYFERYVESLKFLRVVNCPVSRMDNLMNDEFMRGYLSKKTGDSLSPLPPELSNFNVELLAPRGPVDWENYMALELDWLHDDCVGTEKLLHAGNAFRYLKNMQKDRVSDTWYYSTLNNVGAAVGAITMPPTMFAPMVESNLKLEQGIQNYAAALKKNELTPEAVRGAAILNYHNEQILARLEAAGIELRRGEALPMPDKIGPDSYLYDPVTRQPYMLQAKPESPGVVRLSIRRPIMKSTIHSASGDKQVDGWEVMSVLLPANHPGLERVPKAP